MTTSGFAASAVISPDGKSVAYTDKNNGKWSIWLRQLATSENIPVTPPSDDVYGGLTFSRDGNALYFVRGQPGRKLDLYRVSSLGGIPVKLIERTEGWISISPNNKELSFVRCLNETDDSCSLFVSDIEGKNERILVTRPKPFRIGDNQFSPDGKSIAVASGQSASGSDEFALTRIDLESGLESEVTPRKFFDISHLRWLPNGTDILLTARNELSDTNSIWRVSAATGAVEQVTNDGVHYDKVSVDYSAKNAVAVRVDRDFKIWIASTDDPGNTSILAEGEYASFTRDGKIIYQSNDSDIWVIDPKTGEKRQLTNDPKSDINPIISADGEHIFFTSNRSGANHVWRMNIDGSDQRPISRVEGGYPRFATPDGKWVYYQSGLNDSMRKVATDGSEEVAVPKIDGSVQAFSPNGLHIAHSFSDGNSNNIQKIAIRNLSDNALIQTLQLDDLNSRPLSLSWSPDNRSINFVTKADGKYSLWQASLDNFKPVLMGGLGMESLWRFTTSPDGKSIITIRGGWRHNAFLFTGSQ